MNSYGKCKYQQQALGKSGDVCDDGGWLEILKMPQIFTVKDVASEIGHVCLGTGYVWEFSAPSQLYMNLE